MNREPGIIGALLEYPVNGETPFLARILENSPESFDDGRCGQIAAVVKNLRREGQPVHGVAVAERVNFPDCVPFIMQAVNDAFPISIAEPEAEKLWHKFQSRRTAQLFSDAAEAVTADPDAAQGVRQRVIAEAQRLDAEQGNGGLTIRTPDEILAMQFDDGDRILGDRLLAKGQSLVIAGQGGLGKSRLLLQFIAAQRAGLPFIGFETRGQEMTWLVLQAENSNRRLQHDLASLRIWIGDKYWPQVNAGLHIHTLETDADNFLSLDGDRTQARIRELIARIKPDGVAWDSLYNFGVGNLSSDEDMTSTLLAIARLSKAGNQQRAIIALHHALTGKAGASRASGFDRASFGRNSKVLHQWTRAQINVAPGQPDSNDVLVVSCGKCSNGKEFPQFAVRLDQSDMIYVVDESFDLSTWHEQVTGKKEISEPAITSERVGQLCRPLMAKADLCKAVQTDCGCSREMSYKHVRKAERKGAIKWNSKAEHFNPT